MKHMTIALAVMMSTIAVFANPPPRGCPRQPHHNPHPIVHNHHRPYHIRTSEWIGVGLLGAITLNSIVNPPRQTVVVQQPVVIQQQKTAVWIPETRTVTYDSNGNQIITIVPGHYEYR